MAVYPTMKPLKASSDRLSSGTGDDVGTCSDWVLGQILGAARIRSRLWFGDPDRLLTASGDEVSEKLGTGKVLILANHSLALRTILKDGTPRHWVLIDQSTEGRSNLPVFAPDLLRHLTTNDIFKKTVRDFLVDKSGDPGWPLEVEAFPYRELARANPLEFLRAYDDFRAGKETGFSNEDLVLIAGGAVLGLNLFAALQPFQVVELAFYSDAKWARLKEYFGDEQIEIIRTHLGKLPAPLGDLFGNRAQSARLATVALLVLSRHLDSPAALLPNLSASLAPWQDCEPMYAGTLPPTWFDNEVALLDAAISDGFLKMLKGLLDLEKPEKAKEFIESKCWSRKLRELAIPYEQEVKTSRNEIRETAGEGLERLVPRFRGLLNEVEKVVRATRVECDRIRSFSPGQLKMERFVAVFRNHGLCRLPLLMAELRDIQIQVANVTAKPPGFDVFWKTCEGQADTFSSETDDLLLDFDFLLGRFLEARYAAAVPAEIPVINRLLEQVVVPSRMKEPNRPVAIILLDGMRYDLWQEIIRPHLERRYRLDEQVGMALLPSETRISRFGFFSGLKPSDYFEKSYAGGEIAACDALMKRLVPGHGKLEEWPSTQVQALASFAFCTSDQKLFGAVFDFADAIGHVGAWEIGFLADLVDVWLKRFDQVMSLLPKDCVIWITTDHGQVISGPSPIDVPPDWLMGASNGYRSALIKERLPGHHANHVFYLKARDLGYDTDGYWAFPKPGYSFRLQDKEGGARSRFKPIANMRHSGLSAFEVFIPVARLTPRVEAIRVLLTPKSLGSFTVGVSGQIAIEISANCLVQGHVELVGNADGVQPVLVQNVDTTPQTVYIPFIPAKAGICNVQVEARWGFKGLPDPVTVSLQVAAGPSRPSDGLDEKLKKFFA